MIVFIRAMVRIFLTWLPLVEWNNHSFTSLKYSYHCTHKHSLFVYRPSRLPQNYIYSVCSMYCYTVKATTAITKKSALFYPEGSHLILVIIR